MSQQIIHEIRVGKSTYRVEGVVPDENLVALGVSVIDADGAITNVGDLCLPLAQTRRVRDVLFEALKRLESVPVHKAYSLSDIRQEYPNSHAPWTKELKAELQARWESNPDVEEIAGAMGRKPQSIQSQLHRLGKVDDWRYPPA